MLAVMIVEGGVDNGSPFHTERFSKDSVGRIVTVDACLGMWFVEMEVEM